MDGWESTSLAGAAEGRSIEQILIHLSHMELRQLLMWGYSAFPQIKPAKISLSLFGRLIVSYFTAA